MFSRIPIMTYINLFANRVKPIKADLSQRIAEARGLIANADYVLIGAGSGLSTAAGLSYDGDDFRREFRPWINKYGITDLYSSSFYPFKTEEERWAYWAKHIWFARYRAGVAPLYKELLHLVSSKDYFVITTNVDGQFLKSGFDADRLFYTQGDYCYFQDATGDDKHLYYNEEKVMQMLQNTDEDLRIPTEMVPYDPVNGHQMNVNLRCDDTFVEDDNWHRMYHRYVDFVKKAAGKKPVLLEFGVGFNTPVIIRYPFEQMAEESGAALIRFNRDYPQLTFGNPKKFICFQEALDAKLLRQLG